MPIEEIHMGTLQSHLTARKRAGVKSGTVELELAVVRRILTLSVGSGAMKTISHGLYGLVVEIASMGKCCRYFSNHGQCPAFATKSSMICFKSAHFPKIIILYAVFSMSVTAHLIVTWRKLWKSAGSKLTMPFWTVG
jgi:hypothetical protein